VVRVERRARREVVVVPHSRVRRPADTLRLISPRRHFVNSQGLNHDPQTLLGHTAGVRSACHHGHPAGQRHGVRRGPPRRRHREGHRRALRLHRHVEAGQEAAMRQDLALPRSRHRPSQGRRHGVLRGPARGGSGGVVVQQHRVHGIHAGGIPRGAQGRRRQPQPPREPLRRSPRARRRLW
jgi:hypothetical protein